MSQRHQVTAALDACAMSARVASAASRFVYASDAIIASRLALSATTEGQRTSRFQRVARPYCQTVAQVALPRASGLTPLNTIRQRRALTSWILMQFAKEN